MESLCQQMKGNKPGSNKHKRQKTPVSPDYLVSKSKIHTYHAQISPFERVSSKECICKSSLPGFLSEKIIFSQDKPAETLNLNFVDSVILGSKKKDLVVDIKEFVQTGYWAEGFILRIGKIKLTQNDLLSLKPYQEVSVKVLDACMKVIYKENKRKIDEKKIPLARIFIVSAEDSFKLFYTSTPLGLKKDLLKYEYYLFRHIIFPLFIGYWVLITYNLVNKKVQVFDPIGIKTPKKIIKSGLNLFITSELHLNPCFIRNYILSKLTYHFYTESQVYDQFDSPIYILSQTIHLFLSPKFQTSQILNPSIRLHLLYILLKHGTKTYLT